MRPESGNAEISGGLHEVTRRAEDVNAPDLARPDGIGAKVVPMYTEILPNYEGYALRILPAWENYPTGDLTADTRRMNAFFEDAIRPRITEYYWVHKRFKHRPEGMPGIY